MVKMLGYLTFRFEPALPIARTSPSHRTPAIMSAQLLDTHRHAHHTCRSADVPTRGNGSLASTMICFPRGPRLPQRIPQAVDPGYKACQWPFKVRPLQGTGSSRLTPASPKIRLGNGLQSIGHKFHIFSLLIASHIQFASSLTYSSARIPPHKTPPSPRTSNLAAQPTMDSTKYEQT